MFYSRPGGGVSKEICGTVRLLSPPQRPLCIVGRLLCCGEAGEKEKESARGTMGRGKREERLPPFPSSHRPPRAFYFCRLLIFWWGYPAGASAEERGPPASMTSRIASVTFKMASKSFIKKTDKNFDFIMEMLFRFLGFGGFKVAIVIEN